MSIFPSTFICNTPTTHNTQHYDQSTSKALLHKNAGSDFDKFFHFLSVWKRITLKYFHLKTAYLYRKTWCVFCLLAVELVPLSWHTQSLYIGTRDFLLHAISWRMTLLWHYHLEKSGRNCFYFAVVVHSSPQCFNVGRRFKLPLSYLKPLMFVDDDVTFHHVTFYWL